MSDKSDTVLPVPEGISSTQWPPASSVSARRVNRENHVSKRLIIFPTTQYSSGGHVSLTLEIAHVAAGTYHGQLS
jgi:hypothetical protein